MAENRTALSGFVFDPVLDKRHGELRTEVRSAGVDTILDPRCMELGTVGGHSPTLAQLKWAESTPDSPSNSTAWGPRIEAIVEHIYTRGYAATLAPAHYLIDGARDPWFAFDQELTARLRNRLDETGLDSVPIYYPLAIPTGVFNDPEQRRLLIASLNGLAIDAVWLRIHPFGSTSGPLAVRRYIEAARDFHRLRMPIIAERTGTVGLALLGFCGVSGIESGVTLGERFDASSLIKPRRGKGFMRPSRVYVGEIGMFLDSKAAEAFFENPNNKAKFGCHDRSCCKNGTRDMLVNPRRHFLITRMKEVQALGKVPPAIRPTLYMEEILRPATDLARRASRQSPPDLLKSFDETSRRLERWRETLGQMTKLPGGVHMPVAPRSGRIRMSRSA